GVPSNQGVDLPLNEQELLEPRPEYAVQWLNLFGLVADESEVRSMPVEDFAKLYMSSHEIKGDYDTFLPLYRAAATNAIARRRYRIKPYPDRITLFRGNDPGELDLGWNQLAPGRVEVYCFDVGHAELLSAPNSPALAAKLSYCLDNADLAR